jgi:hypothetical protein
MKILDIPRSGSYAGVTSSHNRAGQYVRNRRTPVNTPTPRRTLIRSAFGAAASAYAGLTPAQQAAWIAAAAGHPITDALGQTITLTGQQLYVSVNTALANAGAATVSDPPSDFSVFDPSGDTGVFSLATGVTLTLTGLGDITDFLLVAYSAPRSGGVRFNKTFTQQSVSEGSSTTATLSTADYAVLFGAPVVGQSVFVRLTPVSAAGVTGTPLVLLLRVSA